MGSNNGSTGFIRITEDGFRKLATAASIAALFSYAVTAFITPSALNEIGRSFHASDAVLGTLYFTLSIGFIAAVIIGGRISDKKGKLPSIVLGCVMLGLGACLFAFTSRLLVIFIAVFVMGIGGGLTEGMATAAVADLYKGSRRTAMLNLLHVIFGVGAVVAPIAVSSLIHADMDWRFSYMGAACICAISTLIALAAWLTRYEKPLIAKGEGNWREVLFDPLIFWLSVGILLYVGAECGQANWLAPYFEKDIGSTPAFAALTPAFFWGGISVGRALGAWFSKRMSDYAIICWSLGLAGAAEAALLLAHTSLPAVGSTIILGLCLGPIWPTILSRAGAAHPKQSGMVLGVTIAMGSAGFAIFPSAIGWVGESIGIRSALWVCFVILAINLVIFTRLRASRHSTRGDKNEELSGQDTQ